LKSWIKDIIKLGELSPRVVEHLEQFDSLEDAWNNSTDSQWMCWLLDRLPLLSVKKKVELGYKNLKLVLNTIWPFSTSLPLEAEIQMLAIRDDTLYNILRTGFYLNPIVDEIEPAVGFIENWLGLKNITTYANEEYFKGDAKRYLDLYVSRLSDLITHSSHGPQRIAARIAVVIWSILYNIAVEINTPVSVNRDIHSMEQIALSCRYFAELQFPQDYEQNVLTELLSNVHQIFPEISIKDNV
jgi:hypothetical protein